MGIFNDNLHTNNIIIHFSVRMYNNKIFIIILCIYFLYKNVKEVIMDLKTVNQRIAEKEQQIKELSRQMSNKRNSMKTTQSYTHFYKQLHILENQLKGLEKLKKKLK